MPITIRSDPSTFSTGLMAFGSGLGRGTRESRLAEVGMQYETDQRNAAMIGEGLQRGIDWVGNSWLQQTIADKRNKGLLDRYAMQRYGSSWSDIETLATQKGLSSMEMARQIEHEQMAHEARLKEADYQRKAVTKFQQQQAERNLRPELMGQYMGLMDAIGKLPFDTTLSPQEKGEVQQHLEAERQTLLEIGQQQPYTWEQRWKDNSSELTTGYHVYRDPDTGRVTHFDTREKDTGADAKIIGGWVDEQRDRAKEAFENRIDPQMDPAAIPVFTWSPQQDAAAHAQAVERFRGRYDRDPKGVFIPPPADVVTAPPRDQPGPSPGDVWRSQVSRLAMQGIRTPQGERPRSAEIDTEQLIQAKEHLDQLGNDPAKWPDELRRSGIDAAYIVAKAGWRLEPEIADVLYGELKAQWAKTDEIPQEVRIVVANLLRDLGVGK